VRGGAGDNEGGNVLLLHWSGVIHLMAALGARRHARPRAPL
jgi:hypothetical protein